MTLIAGLLNTCVTALGKKLMHTWHLRPLTNIDEISARHDSIDMLNYPDNQYSVDSVRRALKQVANVGFLLAKIRRSNVTWRDWAKLLDVSVLVWDTMSVESTRRRSLPSLTSRTR